MKSAIIERLRERFAGGENTGLRMKLIVAIGAAAVGAFFGGLTAARLTGKNGLFIGACCGVLLFLLVLAAGFVKNTGVSVGYAFVKLGVLTVLGGIGGALGVNIHRK